MRIFDRVVIRCVGREVYDGSRRVVGEGKASVNKILDSDPHLSNKGNQWLPR